MAVEPLFSEALVRDHYKNDSLEELEYELGRVRNHLANAKIRETVLEKMIAAQKEVLNGIQEKFPKSFNDQVLDALRDQFADTPLSELIEGFEEELNKATSKPANHDASRGLVLKKLIAERNATKRSDIVDPTPFINQRIDRIKKKYEDKSLKETMVALQELQEDPIRNVLGIAVLKKMIADKKKVMGMEPEERLTVAPPNLPTSVTQLPEVDPERMRELVQHGMEMIRNQYKDKSIEEIEAELNMLEQNKDASLVKGVFLQLLLKERKERVAKEVDQATAKHKMVINPVPSVEIVMEEYRNDYRDKSLEELQEIYEKMKEEHKEGFNPPITYIKWLIEERKQELGMDAKERVIQPIIVDPEPLLVEEIEKLREKYKNTPIDELRGIYVDMLISHRDEIYPPLNTMKWYMKEREKQAKAERPKVYPTITNPEPLIEEEMDKLREKYKNTSIQILGEKFGKLLAEHQNEISPEVILMRKYLLERLNEKTEKKEELKEMMEEATAGQEEKKPEQYQI